VGLGFLDSVLESFLGFLDGLFVLSHSLSVLAMVLMSKCLFHDFFSLFHLFLQSFLCLNDRRVGLL